MDAVGRLAGGVAHDFNNLLTAIMGYAGSCLADLPEDDPARAEVAEISAPPTARPRSSRQLLAFSRQQMLAAGSLDLERRRAP